MEAIKLSDNRLNNTTKLSAHLKKSIDSLGLDDTVANRVAIILSNRKQTERFLSANPNVSEDDLHELHKENGSPAPIFQDEAKAGDFVHGTTGTIEWKNPVANDGKY